MRKPHTLRMTIALTATLYGLMPSGVMAQYIQMPNAPDTVSRQPSNNRDACLSSTSRMADAQRAATIRRCNRLVRPQPQPQGGVQTCEAMRWSAPGANPAIVCGGGVQTADGPARQLSY
jgi:hypothetical protein